MQFPPPPAANNEAIAKLRDFSVDLDGRGSYDLVIFDQAKQKVVVCRDGELENCRSFHTSATDVVPLPSQKHRGSDLLIVQPDGAGEVCTIDTYRGVLNCAGKTLAAIAESNNRDRLSGNKRNALRFSNADGAIYCGTKDGVSIECSRSLEIVERKSAYFVGRFTSLNKLEVLTIKGNSVSLCEILDAGVHCQSVASENAFVGSHRVSGQVIDGGKYGIVSLQQGTYDVCGITTSGNRGDAELKCASGRLETASKSYRAFLVPSKSGKFPAQVHVVPTLVGQNKSVSASQSGPPRVNADQKVTLNPSKLYTEHYATEYATSADFVEAKNASGVTQDGKPPAQHVVSAIYNPDYIDYTGGGNYSFPSFIQLFDDDGLIWETWTDVWGYYFVDWDLFANVKTLAECRSDCDAEHASNMGVCNISAGLIAIGGAAFSTGAAIGTAISTVWTGPGSVAAGGAVWITGISWAADVSAVVYLGCGAWAYGQLAQCRRRC